MQPIRILSARAAVVPVSSLLKALGADAPADEPLLKATTKKEVWIEGYTKGDGTFVPGHHAMVHVADDHDDHQVASGGGTYSQKQAHAKLKGQGWFEKLPTEHKSAVVLKHATELQDKASADAAASVAKKEMLAGKLPPPAKLKAFLALPQEKQSAFAQQLAQALGHDKAVELLKQANAAMHLGDKPVAPAAAPAPAPAAAAAANPWLSKVSAWHHLVGKYDEELEPASKEWLTHNPGKEEELSSVLVDMGKLALAQKMGIYKSPAQKLQEKADAAAKAPQDKADAPAPAVEQASGATQTFHNTTGSHNKFWSVTVDGAKVVTHYGKIGTKGQVTEKPFSSAAQAQQFADKLIAEKKGKGYQQVAAAPVPTPSAAPVLGAQHPTPIKAWMHAAQAGKKPLPSQMDAYIALGEDDKHKVLAELSAAGVPESAVDSTIVHTVKHMHAKKAAVAAADAAAPVAIDGWTQTGGQKGSNPGGTFTAPDGSQWYVKFPASDDHVKNELLAAKLYEAAGVAGPTLKPVTKGGKLGIASKWQGGVKQAAPSALAAAAGAREGFAVDAWLANWDAVGLAHDNLLLDAGGQAVRIDVGGSLIYRAQGSPKGSAFGVTVGEIHTLRGKGAHPNAQAGAVFGSMTDADVAESIKKVAALSEQQVRDLCVQFGPGSKAEREQLADKLVARRNDLMKFAESVAPSTIPAEAAAPVAEPGPKEGDTKAAADGGTLVFKNGRWHKQGGAAPSAPKVVAAAEKPAATPLPNLAGAPSKWKKAALGMLKFAQAEGGASPLVQHLHRQIQKLKEAGESGTVSLNGSHVLLNFSGNQGLGDVSYYNEVADSVAALVGQHAEPVADAAGKLSAAPANQGAWEFSAATDELSGAPALMIGHAGKIAYITVNEDGKFEANAHGEAEPSDEHAAWFDALGDAVDHLVDLGFPKPGLSELVQIKNASYKKAADLASTQQASATAGPDIGAAPGGGEVKEDTLASLKSGYDAAFAAGNAQALESFLASNELMLQEGSPDDSTAATIKAANAYIKQQLDKLSAATTPTAGPDAAKVEKVSQEIAAALLPASNTNAGPVNKKLQAIQAALQAGNVAALHAMTFGSNTYGKKAAKLAQLAVAALTEGGAAPAAAAASPAAPAAAPKVVAAAQKPAKAPKAKPDPTKLTVNPSDIAAPPDFVAMKLSSKAHVNESNTADAKALHAFALKGNLKALEDYHYDAIDKETGKLLGKKPIEQHPSGQVKSYWSDLVSTLQLIANPPEALRAFAGVVARGFKSLSELFNGEKYGVSTAKAAANKQLAFWIALGKADAVKELVSNPSFSSLEFAATPKTPVSLTPAMKAKAKADYAKLSKGEAAHRFINGIQSSGTYNDAFRDGKALTGDGYDAVAMNLAAHEYAQEKPAGFEIYKWISLGDKMVQQLLHAPDGVVFQNPGSMCCSIHPTATHGFGSHRVRIRYAPGAKGVDSFGSGRFGSEQEITTLPGARYVVLSSKMVDCPIKGQKRLELDVMMLPPDETYVADLKVRAKTNKAGK